MKSERDGINPAVEPSGTGCVECLALGGQIVLSGVAGNAVAAELAVARDRRR